MVDASACVPASNVHPADRVTLALAYARMPVKALNAEGEYCVTENVSASVITARLSPRRLCRDGVHARDGVEWGEQSFAE